MNANNYCIILAGGKGRRLWPCSRENKPKQFIDFFGVGKTQLQDIFERFVKIMPKENSICIPIFSDNFNERDFPLPYGWKMLSKPICKLDWGETEISIAGIFGNAINQMIDYHLKNNINIDLFISIKLRDNRCIIEDGYYVDWERRMLVFTNVNYTHTYRLLIAVNNLYINDMLVDMYGKS